MPLETTTNRVNQNGDDVTTRFFFAFKTYDVADINVYLDAVLQMAGYTVTLNVDQVSSPGGYVDFTVPPTSAPQIVTIERKLSLLQGINYPSGGSFPSATHTTALDEVYMILQQLQDESNRSIKAAVSIDEDTVYTLPSATAQRFLRWNDAGTDLENFDIADLGLYSVSAYAEVFLTKTTAALARAYLDTPSNAEAVLDSFFTAKGIMAVGTAAGVVGTVTKNELAPVGSIVPMTGSVVPTGYLHLNGAAISLTSYEDLYDYWVGAIYGLDTAVAAFTADSSLDVFTSAAHGLVDDTIVEVTNSGGALPTGLSAGTKYFIITATTNTFQLSLTQGGAAVDITDNGTGTHSFHTKMLLPDNRGEFLRGYDNSAGVDPDAASRTDRGDGTTGDNVGTKQDHGISNHTHQFNTMTSSDTNAYGLADATRLSTGFGTRGGAGTLEGTFREYIGDSSANNPYIKEGSEGNFTTETRPINAAVMWCIKY